LHLAELQPINTEELSHLEEQEAEGGRALVSEEPLQAGEKRDLIRPEATSSTPTNPSINIETRQYTHQNPSIQSPSIHKPKPEEAMEKKLASPNGENHG
jgi:hypothetical protein